MVKVVSLRGGCARGTPLSMLQLLLIPTATTTVESSATITIMPSSTLGFACAVSALRITERWCKVRMNSGASVLANGWELTARTHIPAILTAARVPWSCP